MNIFRTIFVFKIIIIFSIHSFSQDIHFSQFYNSPLIINPALTGNINEEFRAGINYRNQGESITIPYKTFSVFLDAKLIPNFLRNSEIGIGGLFYNDNAGEGNLQNSTGMLFSSLTKGFNRYNTFLATIGFSVGFFNRSVNLLDLTFDDQWNGTIFDPTLANNEPITNNSVFAINFNFGALISYSFSPKIIVKIGSSISHINQPKVSFYDSVNRLDQKYIFHGEVKVEINNFVSISPGFMYSTQGENYEALFGSNISFGESDLKINCGLWYRLERDIIPVVGLIYDNYYLSISYNVNISSLHRASNYSGGYEISLIKSFSINKKYLPCRSF
ncbi:MAG: PorP/SprF family type IX secretion system membrane protein [Bacteroidales bacterium]|nr:PorP/SprF family type IX secretion system membrane protein [Bacteroidales bacterium]